MYPLSEHLLGMVDFTEYESGDEKDYQWFRMHGKTLRFGVKAAHDCHLAFSHEEGTEEPLIEVFIGGWNNEYSCIRYNEDEDLVKLQTLEILSEDEYREFWVTLCHKEVRVGKGGERQPFMTAPLPHHFRPKYCGYTTAWGSPGTFKFLRESEVMTDDSLEYQFQPLFGRTLNFSVACDHDAHLCFTEGPEKGEPMYEVFLGGWDNQYSIIRKNGDEDKIKISTPDECEPALKGYEIDFHDGRISVRRHGEHEPFLSWEDDEAFEPCWFGFCTCYGSTGTWRFDV